MSMTELERRCVDALAKAQGLEPHEIAALPISTATGNLLDEVRAVLAEAGVTGLPSCAGVVAYDRDECTVTFALDTEQQVADVVAAYPHRNRIHIEANQ